MNSKIIVKLFYVAINWDNMICESAVLAKECYHAQGRQITEIEQNQKKVPKLCGENVVFSENDFLMPFLDNLGLKFEI